MKSSRPTKKRFNVVNNYIHLLTERHFWLFLANVWLMVGVAIPSGRGLDAFLCAVIAGICFFKADD